MITDCHTHFWHDACFSPPWSTSIERIASDGKANDRDNVSVEAYREGVFPAERSIVFGIQAQASGIMVPNDETAKFVAELGDSAVGFMSVDPTMPGALEEMERAAQDLGLRGLKLGAPYQSINPTDPRAMAVFRQADKLGLPVIIHQGAIFTNAGRMFDANPVFIDDVATAFPNLPIIIAHVGHPWVHETAIVMRRHPNVFADLSAIPRRPQRLANALAATKEYGVADKLLFGSDFPLVTVESTIAGIRAVNEHMRKSWLTSLDDDELEAIFHRDTFALIGID